MSWLNFIKEILYKIIMKFLSENQINDSHLPIGNHMNLLQNVSKDKKTPLIYSKSAKFIRRFFRFIHFIHSIKLK